MPVFKGLLVDAAGTLLSPSEPAAEVRWGRPASMPEAAWAAKFRGPLTQRTSFSQADFSPPGLQVYLRIAKKYGCDLSANEVLRRYRWACGPPCLAVHRCSRAGGREPAAFCAM